MPLKSGAVCGKENITTLSTAGAITYDAYQWTGNHIRRDPNGASRTDVTPTAALIKQELEPILAAQSGYFFWTKLTNTSNGTAAGPRETITLTGGTGITIVGPTKIQPLQCMDIMCMVNNPATPTFTFYTFLTSTQAPVFDSVTIGTTGLYMVPVSGGPEAANAVTVNGEAVTFTTSALNIAAGAEYVITLTNSAILPLTAVYASMTAKSTANGTAVVCVTSVDGTLGTCILNITNLNAAVAIDGTITIFVFLVHTVT